MPDPPDLRDDAPDTPQGPSPTTKKKKKDKVRAAWISFVGRITAQILVAAATIVLGVIVLHRGTADRSPATDPKSRPVGLASPRIPGEVALAVLPLNNFSGDPRQD